MPKPYMTPIKFGKENQEDKDRKDKNLFQYDAFQRRVNMDAKTLTYPILATFLAPYIRNSSLYKDEFWDVRTYDVRDEIRIEEGLDCYLITRIRKDSKTGEIITVSEQIPLPKEAREKFDIVCKEIYTWAHARLADSSDQDRQDQINVDIDDNDDRAKHWSTPLNNELRAILGLPDNHFGFSLIHSEYNDTFQAYARAPLKNLRSHEIAAKTLIVHMRDMPGNGERFILLLESYEDLKKRFFSRKKNAPLLKAIKQCIDNMRSGSIDPESMEILRRIAVYKRALENNYSLFTTSSRQSKIDALDFLEKSMCAVINGIMSRLQLLVEIAATINQMDPDLEQTRFHRFLTELQGRLQSRNISSLKDGFEKRIWNLSTFYTAKFCSDSDLITFFGENQVGDTLSKIQQHLEKVDLMDENLPLFRMIFLDCFKDFNDPASHYANKIAAILTTLEGLEHSKSFLDHFYQGIGPSNRKLEILTTLAHSLNQPHTDISRKFFLNWLFLQHPKHFSTKRYFNLLIESGLLNILLTHMRLYGIEFDNQQLLFNNLQTWLREHPAEDKPLGPLRALYAHVPNLFKIEKMRDDLIEKARAEIMAVRKIDMLRKIHELNIAIPERFLNLQIDFQHDSNVIADYLTLVAWGIENVEDITARLLRIIKEDDFEAPIHDRYLSHVTYQHMKQSQSKLFARIISNYLHQLQNNSSSESLMEFLAILNNRHALNLLLKHLSPLDYSNAYPNLLTLVANDAQTLLENRDLETIKQRYLDPACPMVLLMTALQTPSRLLDTIAKTITSHSAKCTEEEYLTLFYSPIREQLANADNNCLMQIQFLHSATPRLMRAIREEISLLLKPHAPKHLKLFERLTQEGQNQFNAILTYPYDNLSQDKDRIDLLVELKLLYIFNTKLKSAEAREIITKGGDNSFKEVTKNSRLPELIFIDRDVSCQYALMVGNHDLDQFALTGILHLITALERGTQALYQFGELKSCNLVALMHSATEEEILFAEMSQQLNKIDFNDLTVNIEALRYVSHNRHRTPHTTDQLISIWKEYLRSSPKGVPYRAFNLAITNEFPESMPARQQFLVSLASADAGESFSEPKLNFEQAFKTLSQDPSALLKNPYYLRYLFSIESVNDLLKILCKSDRNAYRKNLLNIRSSITATNKPCLVALSSLIDVLADEKKSYSIDALYQSLNESTTFEDCQFLYLIGNDEQRVTVASHLLLYLSKYDILLISNSLTPDIVENDFKQAYQNLPNSFVAGVKRSIGIWIKSRIEAQLPLDHPLILALANISNASKQQARPAIIHDSNGINLEEPIQKVQSMHLYKTIIQETLLSNMMCLSLIEILNNHAAYDENLLGDFIKRHQKSHHNPQIYTYKIHLTTLLERCKHILSTFLENCRLALEDQPNGVLPPSLEYLHTAVSCFEVLEQHNPKSEIEIARLELKTNALFTLKEALSPIPMIIDAYQNEHTTKTLQLKNQYAAHFIYCFVSPQKRWLCDTIESLLPQLFLSTIERSNLIELHDLEKHFESNASLINSSTDLTVTRKDLMLQLRVLKAKITSLLLFRSYLAPEFRNICLSLTREIETSLPQFQLYCAGKLGEFQLHLLFIHFLKHTIFTDIIPILIDKISLLANGNVPAKDKSSIIYNLKFREVLHMLCESPVISYQEMTSHLDSLQLNPKFKQTIVLHCTAIYKCAQIFEHTLNKMKTEPNGVISLAYITKMISWIKQAIDNIRPSNLEYLQSTNEPHLIKIDQHINALEMLLSSLTLADSAKESILLFLNDFDDSKKLYQDSNPVLMNALIMLFRIVHDYNSRILSTDEFSRLLESVSKLDVPGLHMFELQRVVMTTIFKPLVSNSQPSFAFSQLIHHSHQMIKLHQYMVSLQANNQAGQIRLIIPDILKDATCPQPIIRQATIVATKELVSQMLKLRLAQQALKALDALSNDLSSLIELFTILNSPDLSQELQRVYRIKLLAHCENLLAGKVAYSNIDKQLQKNYDLIALLCKTPRLDFTNNQLQMFIKNFKSLVTASKYQEPAHRIAITNALLFIEDFANEQTKQDSWKLLFNEPNKTTNACYKSVLSKLCLILQISTPTKVTVDMLVETLKVRFIKDVVNDPVDGNEIVLCDDDDNESESRRNAMLQM